MRHLATLIAALIVAPLSWLLLAFGQDRSAEAFTNAQATGAVETADLVRPLACLVAAGLLLGLFATRRFSRLGVLVTGVGYLAGYLVLLVAPAGVLRLFPHSVTVADRSADPTTPLRTGTVLLLGALLVAATIAAGRRRRRPAAAAPEPERKPPAGARRPDPAKPATFAKPEFVTRYASEPRRLGNARSNSYGPSDRNADRWQQTRQSAWPYG